MPIYVSVLTCPLPIHHLPLRSLLHMMLNFQIRNYQPALCSLDLVLLVVFLMDSGNCSPLPSSRPSPPHVQHVLFGSNLWHPVVLTTSLLLNTKGKYLVDIRISRLVQRNPVTQNIAAEMYHYTVKRLSSFSAQLD